LVGFPSLKDLKKIIMLNAIANCLITHNDVDITKFSQGQNDPKIAEYCGSRLCQYSIRVGSEASEYSPLSGHNFC
jgi:hypothetical protein